MKLSALADTGGDLIWAKCGACVRVLRAPGLAILLPRQSSSLSKLPSRSEGYLHLSSETVTLGGDAMDGVGFGCTTMSVGNFGRSSGLVGLGRWPLSLVSQLDVGAFSYFLIPYTDPTAKPSPLLFGSLATLTGAGVQSTPLLPSVTTFYSVNLQSISFGSATTACFGMVFDSGTTLTYLAEPAYTAAKDAVLQQAAALPRAANRHGFEACFQASAGGGGSGSFPAMVLHFDGGADMALPTANYMLEVGARRDGVSCWGVQRSPAAGTSIIGNIMQMNFHIRYDVDRSMLSFLPANCSIV
uniref:Peptidase A1 domain-containing protein n=1 Tax=Oryza meridionalis TaxID=40149 RepID=A0A0E0F3U3_9ORYZ